MEIGLIGQNTVNVKTVLKTGQEESNSTTELVTILKQLLVVVHVLLVAMKTLQFYSMIEES